MKKQWIARNGQPEITIIKSSNCTEQEEYAAQELKTTWILLLHLAYHRRRKYRWTGYAVGAAAHRWELLPELI